MKRNQRGFGAVEGLLFLILLSILGFTGYYVYHAKNNANSTYTTTAKTGSDTPISSAWQTYNGEVSDQAQNPAVEADQIAYTFQYPSSWKFYPIGTEMTSGGQTSSISFQEIGPSQNSDKSIRFNSVTSSKNAKDYYTAIAGDQSKQVGPIWQGVGDATTRAGYSGYTTKLDASTGTVYETYISNNKTGLVVFNYGSAAASDSATLQRMFRSVNIP